VIRRVALVLVCLAVAFAWTARPRSQGVVTVTGIARNHSSVRFFYNPVPGAADYRLYDVTDPTSVKYAGLWHLVPSSECPGSSCFNFFQAGSGPGGAAFPFNVLTGASGGPQVLDIPALELDWNTDGQPHTVVIQAVNQLGPAVRANQYTKEGPSGSPHTPLGAGMLGSNKGPTPDGKTSTNGQGPYTNNPTVIAQSPPMLVQANSAYAAIPSAGYVTQTFFDTFEDAEGSTITQTVRTDNNPTDTFGNVGIMDFSMNAGTAKEWEIFFRRANNNDSHAFISNNHFMEMVFDGTTPGLGGPTHNNYASMAMSPTPSFSISGGRMVHITMEVDGHQSFRRWMAIDVSPSANPIRGWHPEGDSVTATNQAIFLETKHQGCTLDIYTGPTGGLGISPTGTAGAASGHGSRLWGPSGGGTAGGHILCAGAQNYVTRNLSQDSRGLDDKNRFDFFLSATHAAFFQDGELIIESDIPPGTFPWANDNLRVFYTHYLYHSINDFDELATFSLNGANLCYALNSFWFNDPVNGTASGATVCGVSYPSGYGFPHSDERHWDNMGFEVIPAANVPATPWETNIPTAMIALPSTDAPTFAETGARFRLRIRGADMSLMLVGMAVIGWRAMRGGRAC
jgi:hypothetical protein